MTCPHLPGPTRLFMVGWMAALCVAATALSPVAHAAPTAAASASGAGAAGAKKKQASTSHTKTAGAKAGTKNKASNGVPGASKSANKSGAKKTTKTRGKSTRRGAAAAGTAGAAAAMAANPSQEGNGDNVETSADNRVRLPLMLRVTPALPDNLAALRSRLEGIVTQQAPEAAVDSVTQLGPDIYAFSLRCTDAEQCQRLRLAIESERDWVAGLQLDERRHIPRTPERRSPAAR